MTTNGFFVHENAILCVKSKAFLLLFDEQWLYLRHETEKYYHKYKQTFKIMNRFLPTSSVGKKLLMSISGVGLVLFLIFHMSMNITAIFSPEAYNMICAFLGANWYALVATMGLAALVVVHIAYAFILTMQNYKARGNQRYAVTKKEPGVSWASKNMLALGVIVVIGMLVHLYNFWAKMQLVEILGHHEVMVGGQMISPTDGSFLIAYTFSQPVYVVLYLIWFAALWFHLTHGVWSMFQSAGFANDVWYPRLKCISNITATLIFLGFTAVVVFYYAQSLCGACCA